MKTNYYLLAITLIVLLASCTRKKTIPSTSNPADQLLMNTFDAHGGDKYNTAHYSFVFRGKTYTFKNENGKYNYQVNYIDKENQAIKLNLNNEGVKKEVNGTISILSPKQEAGYSGNVNSVIYFATLPHKLMDPAVIKKYIGQDNVKGKNYEILHISFTKENGGQDHDDNFYYWINTETHRIDYLAYNYKVGKGGVRFRSAFNPRMVDGILFQDYVNYKAPVGTPLADLSKLYETDQLEKLSLIETEEVKKQ